MPEASHVVNSFLGGEISQAAQGRFDRPDYRASLNVCLNAFPVEIGPWTRRPGTQYAGHTRAGATGRVVKFDFEASAPVTMEFTDGYLRFRDGATLITTNDAQAVVAISTANPAVVQLTSAATWATGDTAIFPGKSTPLLENRQFKLTKIDTTHFSLSDPLTSTDIDGSTLGALAAGTTIERVHELQTTYVGGDWSSVRAVQAETTDILLSASVPPQALTVSTLPTSTTNPVFALNAANFLDGPYLDAFTNGIQVTPGSQSGIVTLSLSFPTYSASTAYPKDAFVLSAGTNYQSLADQNVGNTPAISPTFWQAVSLGAAINNGRGILGSDVGRLVRLFSEPAAWASGTTYAVGNIVSYNPSGVAGANTYWQSLTASNTGNTPGKDAKNWSLQTTNGAAVWTWGKITGLGNAISGGTGTNIGNMTGGGGLAGAFNGNLSQNSSAGATLGASGGSVAYGTILTFSSYVGKNYSGVGGEAIDHVTVYPSTDRGLGSGDYTWVDIFAGGRFYSLSFVPSFVLNLRGKNTAPASASDGTILGTTGTIGNTTAPINITSSSSSAFNYVWVELVATAQVLSFSSGLAWPTFAYNFGDTIGQVTFFNPPGTGTGDSFNVEILGPSLLYTNLITNWRMGVYSATTGYPTCGCYHAGRLYLGGCVANRWDASYSNGVNGGTLNFAPTDQYGAVTAAHALSYVLNSDDVNQIQWMVSDQQGVFMGTLAAEWLTFAPTAGPIAPNNVESRRVTQNGSANAEPARTEHTVLFIRRFARKIMEGFADVFSGKFTAPNLAERASHITRNVVAQLAYTSAVTPIVWGRCNDGSWFGCTYKRDTLTTSQGPTYAAFHRHTLGTGRTVTSICGGPSTDGELDTLTMVTTDGAINHVEVLTNTPDELTSLATSWFLDDAVNPTSVSDTGTGLTINGLWHLNGKTVVVFAGGLDCGDIGDVALPWVQTKTYASGDYSRGMDANIYLSLAGSNIGHDPISDGGTHWQLIGTGLDFVVSNGSITVPYGDGVSAGAGAGLFTQAFAAGLALTEIVVGCTYNSDGQIVRPQLPQDTGARSGPAFSKISRDHFLGALLVNTLGISFGCTFDDLIPARFTKADDVTPIASLSMFSGLYTDIPNCDYSRFEEKTCWRVSRPFPATVVAIGTSLSTQDQ